MKKKAVVLGLVGAMALGTCTVSAASGTRNISATFRNIKIVVDGKQVSTSAEPFIYNGTTYLPIRAVGEAVGKEVTWNAGTNTVYLGEVPAGAQQQAPVTPETPAAAGSLPILAEYGGQYIGAGEKETASAYSEAVRSGDVSAFNAFALAEIYMSIISWRDADSLAWSAYAEAQAAFASAPNDPYWADAKAKFEDFWQNDILPSL